MNPVIKDISEVISGHLKRICKELSKEGQFNYTLHECKMEAGKIHFGVYYTSEKQNTIGSRVLIEKEIEVKDIDTFEVKNRLRSKLIKGSEEKLKIKKAVK